MNNWLHKINDPADLRGLSIPQLKAVCEEIRDEILRVMAANSGHLASSLGAVELCVALHHLYMTPRDRLVWDVGHQAYAHKILTGRRDQFPTIRKENGLSGFLKRTESPYDTFGAGHASTSISAAVGMAIARDQKRDDYRVVSITGDGAMSGGICYEALNNAGTLGSDLLIVLNDNTMSISKNTGALSSAFNRIVTTHFYNERRKEVSEFIKRLPAGESMARFGHKIQESVKGLILPGVFFEELGIRYLGPIDGNDLDELIPTLRKIQQLSGPILLHIVTVKGKGRDYSEADPIKWHAPPLNFDLKTGKAPRSKPAPPKLQVVFADALREVARRDDKVVALTAAMLEGTSLTRFEKEFPERTFDVGIAEEHAVICAAGMACDGLRPFVCVYSTFLQRAFDPILHDVCIQNLPVAFALDRGGLVGADGPTHHGVFDISYLRMMPNMVVMAPMDAEELRAMTWTAHKYIEEGRGPIALRFPRGSAKGILDVNDAPAEIEIGKAEVLTEGETVCLIAIGGVVAHAVDAAKILEKEDGLRPTVVNARFVKPLDTELLASLARSHKHLITIEDNVKAGGFGSAVNEALGEMGSKNRAIVLGVPDKFLPHGTQASLFEMAGISASCIVERVRLAVKKQRKPRRKAAPKAKAKAKSAPAGLSATANDESRNGTEAPESRAEISANGRESKPATRAKASRKASKPTGSTKD